MKLYYRLYCITDDRWEYLWQDSDLPLPTTCPTNAAHTINSNSVSEFESSNGPGGESSIFSSSYGYYYNENNDQIKTSSVRDVLISQITNLYMDSGQYRFEWYIKTDNSKNRRIIVASFKRNDSELIDSVSGTVHERDSNLIIQGFKHIFIPTSGTSSFQAYFKQEDDDNTTIISSIRLVLMKI